MIRKCDESDIVAIYGTINDAATVYRGVIPDDQWHEPYMSYEELKQELDRGVIFWGFVDGEDLAGVMGTQDKGEVCLIRHAYVKSEQRRSGIGTRLLQFLESKIDKPILIGTWADAAWAIVFYQRNGYHLLQEKEKNKLLRKYWNIPQRQIETSVVLANAQWLSVKASRCF